MIDIEQLKKVHFIGITSGFNSFCANYLLQQGVAVTASELNQESGNAQQWIERGVLYEGGHDAKYITDDLDLVVCPTGPIPGNPECVVAESKSIPMISIAKLTGIISKNFKVIAVAGTHGKTTTSALIVWMFYKAIGKFPNFIIGDDILQINKSWNFNPESEYLIMEACEYKEQFLDRTPSPFISVITNIELDHTDYYPTQKQYNDAFVKFLRNTEKAIVIDKEGENETRVLNQTDTDELDIINISTIREEYSNITAGLKGEFNKENIFKACGVGKYLNLDIDIEDFPGVASRYEYKGKTEYQMPIYLDYAHNPRKITACLSGAKESFKGKKILFVWQPHSYERVYSFKKQFAESIQDADVVYIPNIYAPTREEKRYQELISQEEFVEYLKNKNKRKEIELLNDSGEFKKTSKLILDKKFDSGFVCILASAGDLKNILKHLNLT